MDRRTGAKLANGLSSGLGVAVLAAAGFADPKGRTFRRERKVCNEVSPRAGSWGDRWGTADWDGGPFPDGVLFGDTRPSWGTDRELGRELLGGLFCGDFGESKGIDEDGWGILVCLAFVPLSVVTSMIESG